MRFPMATWLVVLLVTLASTGAGLGGALAGHALSRPSDAPQQISVAIDDAAHVQAEAQRELSSLDLVEPLCATTWLAEDTDGTRRLLCREALCWAHSHSTTGGPNQAQCDPVSNLTNSLAILEACGDTTTDTGRACLAIVQSRK